MKALRWNGGRVQLQELPAPVPKPGEALVRVRMAGICNTDLEIVRGYMGYEGTLGHEFVGEVVDGSAELQGQRVAGEINVGCSHCERCRSGLSRHCESRTVLGIVRRDGCFAEYLTLPEHNLHPIPTELSDVAACFVEPVAAAFEILEQVDPQPGDALVLGDGKLGQLIAQVLQAHDMRVTLLGKHESKLTLAAMRGINTTIQPPDSRFDLVVEATGSQSGLQRAIALTRPRGTLVLKSTYHGSVTLDMSPLVIDEITLLGSRCGPFAPAIDALAKCAVDPLPLVCAQLPLTEGEQAMALAQTPGALKVLLEMTEMTEMTGEA